jgi:DnaK suppressor protein
MSDSIDLEMFRDMLLRRREAIDRISETGRDAAQTVELDQTRTGRLSRMDALQSQAMARAAEGRRRLELQRIEAALARLDEGTFGECLACGDMISVGRLKTDPTATLCLACAQRAEEAAVKR